jgi:hypothetical protein
MIRAIDGKKFQGAKNQMNEAESSVRQKSGSIIFFFQPMINFEAW